VQLFEKKIKNPGGPMNEIELRQALLNAEEPIRARQQVEWVKLRERLYDEEPETTPAYLVWRNLGLATLAVAVAAGLFWGTLGKSSPSPVAVRKPTALEPLQVTLMQPVADVAPVSAPPESSQIIFASQELPEITTSTFYSPEANADVIWLTNTGFVQE
jgi:hypothetical protein